MIWGLVAQWITRLTTDQKIPGSNPGKFDFFLFGLNFTGTMNYIVPVYYVIAINIPLIAHVLIY